MQTYLHKQSDSTCKHLPQVSGHRWTSTWPSSSLRTDTQASSIRSLKYSILASAQAPLEQNWFCYNRVKNTNSHHSGFVKKANFADPSPLGVHEPYTSYSSKNADRFGKFNSFLGIFQAISINLLKQKINKKKKRNNKKKHPTRNFIHLWYTHKIFIRK